MTGKLATVLYILWLFYGSPSAPPLPAQTFRYQLAGRSYLIHLPTQLPPKPPLLIVLHGAAGNAAQIERLTGFSTIADREHFIVVYPEGINGRWNDGRDLPGVNSDDVGFIRDLITTVINQWYAGPERVYVTGFSNGATFANRLACELSDRISGIAPVSGGLAQGVYDRCRPVKPVSYLGINGNADPIVPYVGGTIQFAMSGDRGSIVGADRIRDFWTTVDACRSGYYQQLPNGANDGTTSATQSRSQCLLNTRVQGITIDQGGHKYPGVDNLYRNATLDAALGRTSFDFNASETIWAFFNALPPRYSPAQIAAAVQAAYFAFSGDSLSGESLIYWCNAFVSLKLTTPAELTAFYMAQYFNQSGTAEGMARNALFHFQGGGTSPDSVAHWASIMRQNYWTYEQLMDYFLAYFLPRPGSAEVIVTQVFLYFAKQLPDSISLKYWSDGIRTARWNFRQLLAYFVANYPR